MIDENKIKWVRREKKKEKLKKKWVKHWEWKRQIKNEVNVIDTYTNKQKYKEVKKKLPKWFFDNRRLKKKK